MLTLDYCALSLLFVSTLTELKLLDTSFQFCPENKHRDTWCLSTIFTQGNKWLDKEADPDLQITATGGDLRPWQRPIRVSCEDLSPVQTEDFSSQGTTVTLSYNFLKKELD
ncbi:hypothetical protein INR49_027200 [Caranx melampygus]|nr:hypothetical protein INR49_027200 [Caranx melampygus]